MRRRSGWSPALRLSAAPGTELRILRGSDAPAFLDLIRRNRAQFRRWIPDATHVIGTDRQIRAFVRSAKGWCRRRITIVLGIWHKKALVGIVSIGRFNRYNLTAEIGYLLDTAHQGRGIAMRSCRALVDHAFRRLKLHALEVRITASNRRSLALARRLGFRRVGRFRGGQRLGRRREDIVIMDHVRGEGNLARA